MLPEITIKKKLEELEKTAESNLKHHMKLQQENDPSAGAYLHGYNIECERIWTLKWVLGLSKEI